MAKLRVGLVGCGRIAQLVHLPLLMRLPDVELTALAESDPARREEAARRAPPFIRRTRSCWPIRPLRPC